MPGCIPQQIEATAEKVKKIIGTQEEQQSRENVDGRACGSLFLSNAERQILFESSGGKDGIYAGVPDWCKSIRLKQPLPNCVCSLVYRL